jgi:hypothetical protein
MRHASEEEAFEGVVGLVSMDMFIIEIIIFIVGHET